MNPAAGRKRDCGRPCGVELPQTRLGDELADGRQRHAERLVLQHPPCFVGGDGQDQLKIFAVAERMFQGAAAVPALFRQQLRRRSKTGTESS